MPIPFSKPYFNGREVAYIKQAMHLGKVSGNGIFTQKCQTFFEQKYGFNRCLLTASCTDALEMAALLLQISSGDEVIMPSYTFVSTANPFVLRGARIVFADSYETHPNIDPQGIEALITPKTKAIVVVHYAGVACDMDAILHIAQKHGLFVVEDAAQAINSYYKGKPLGSFGHLATFSFHQDKNITMGQGGMLVINKDEFVARAEILWEKGTNRQAFFKGEVEKYSWMDVGSSFLPSEINAAVLWAQIETLEDVQHKRLKLWHAYKEGLQNYPELEDRIKLPYIPQYASNNAHIFYLLCQTEAHRAALITFLAKHGISAVFHYLSLHNSPFYASKHDGRVLKNSDAYTSRLVRLPLYIGVPENIVQEIMNLIRLYHG